MPSQACSSAGRSLQRCKYGGTERWCSLQGRILSQCGGQQSYGGGSSVSSGFGYGDSLTSTETVTVTDQSTQESMEVPFDALFDMRLDINVPVCAGDNINLDHDDFLTFLDEYSEYETIGEECQIEETKPTCGCGGH